MDGQAARAQDTVARHVFQSRNPATGQIVIDEKALHRPGELKVISCAVFDQRPLQTCEIAPDSGHTQGRRRGIGHCPSRIRSGHHHPVSHRATPIYACIQASQTVSNPQNAAHIARIAVRIPARRVDNSHRTAEISVAIQQRHNDHGVIGHNVAVASVAVIAVTLCDTIKGVVPAGIHGMPFPHVGNDPIDQRVVRNQPDSCIQQGIDALFEKGRRNHPRDHLGTIDGFAIVADAGRAAREIRGALWIPRADQPPAIDKDL